MRRALPAVRGESTNGRVASAGGPYARRGGAGDVGVHRRAAATKQTAPPRRNPEGAWVLRAIAALLLLDDPHRDRLRRRALRSPHNTHARDPLYFHHGLLASAASDPSEDRSFPSDSPDRTCSYAAAPRTATRRAAGRAPKGPRTILRSRPSPAGSAPTTP